MKTTTSTGRSNGSATFTELTVALRTFSLRPLAVVIDFGERSHVPRDALSGGNERDGGRNRRIGAGGRQNLAINGDVNLRVFSGLSPDVFSSGVARLFLRITGSYEDPRFLGTGEVNGASVSVFSGDQTITVSNLTGLIRFNSNQAQIERLTGTLGGGKVTVSGGALLAGSARGRFALNARGENVTLNYPRFSLTRPPLIFLNGDMTTQSHRYVNVSGQSEGHRSRRSDRSRPETTVKGGQFLVCGNGSAFGAGLRVAMR